MADNETRGLAMSAENQDAGGISRRTLIKASVAAGGLAWSAPMLLGNGPGAFASDSCRHCEGTLFQVKIASTESANCGSSCLTVRGDIDPGKVRCGECLIDTLIFVDFQELNKGPNSTGTVTLAPSLTLVSASSDFAGPHATSCFFADCPAYDDVRADGTAASGVITVNGQVITFSGTLQKPLSHVQLLVCYTLPGTPIGC